MPRRDAPTKPEPSKPSTGAAVVEGAHLDFVACVEHCPHVPVSWVDHNKSLLD